MFLLTAMTEDRTYVPSDLLSYFINKFVLFCDITAIFAFSVIVEFRSRLKYIPNTDTIYIGIFWIMGKEGGGRNCVGVR